MHRYAVIRQDAPTEIHVTEEPLDDGELSDLVDYANIDDIVVDSEGTVLISGRFVDPHETAKCRNCGNPDCRSNLLIKSDIMLDNSGGLDICRWYGGGLVIIVDIKN